MVRHLDVDLVRSDGPDPALVDDRRQLTRDVQAPLVAPAGLEPPLQRVRRLVVGDLGVELSLEAQPGEGKVAAAEVTDDGSDGFLAMCQIQLRVQRVAGVELDYELSGFQLKLEPLQTLLVGLRRSADGQLSAELLGHLLLEAERGLVVHAVIWREPYLRAQLVVRQLLHTDQQPAARALRRVPVA